MVSFSYRMVRKGGIEPPRVLAHRILNPARLPSSATFAPEQETFYADNLTRRLHLVKAIPELFRSEAAK